MLIAIIGGGPAGLNAALLLARANRRVIILDAGRPRNRVTSKMHNFLTREGISPRKFRSIAHDELLQYKHVKLIKDEAIQIIRTTGMQFQIRTNKGRMIVVDRILLATGLSEQLPTVKNIEQFYGKSIFSCPYCDGYNFVGKTIGVIAEGKQGLALTLTLRQWSKHITWFTNGKYMISDAEKEQLRGLDIFYNEAPITELVGENGILQFIRLKTGARIKCSGAFISTYWRHPHSFIDQLGLRQSSKGGIWQDGLGRTSVAGIYIAGDATVTSPAQSVVAAGEGVKSAMTLNQDLIAAGKYN